jgi:hypothetical protein
MTDDEILAEYDLLSQDDNYLHMFYFIKSSLAGDKLKELQEISYKIKNRDSIKDLEEDLAKNYNFIINPNTESDTEILRSQ